MIVNRRRSIVLSLSLQQVFPVSVQNIMTFYTAFMITPASHQKFGFAIIPIEAALAASGSLGSTSFGKLQI